MDIVNRVGCEINLISQRPFLSGPLQFTSGLGERKAKHLIYKLKETGIFLSRQEIFDTNKKYGSYRY